MYPKVLEDYFTHRKEYGYIMRMGSHVFFNGMAVGETTTSTRRARWPRRCTWRAASAAWSAARSPSCLLYTSRCV